MKSEKIQANQLNAPILFVGTGGVGSKIIKGVADRCVHDDTSNLRFVVLDTDVNDLLNVNKGANIIAIQTSSTSTVGDYLDNDHEAKEKWFPVNKMLDPKPLSEGAGQIRAISRIALNATVKQGNIGKLYKAIDDLFLKDGGSFKQAIRVVIASTAAGGTGSGIAMELGMLIRHYVKKNYPEAATMIRGFLVMPGVLDTVIDTQSERDSIRCNGYATIKEINAFMMKGSGFFDTVPELYRYRDLHLALPGAGDSVDKLSNLPFDFCFLMDRTDSNTGNMPSLPQYIDFAAQSIYEQNIGPMRTRANSMEDNVLKLCISPKTLGRCRFGGVGASKLVYPYEDIRDYIALNWARAALIGSSSDSNLSESDRKKLLADSWLQYDAKFAQEYQEYLDNPDAAGEEPRIEVSYVNAMNEGQDAASGNAFTANLWRQYINPKIKEITKAAGNNVAGVQMKTMIDHIGGKAAGSVEFTSTQKVARAYLSKLIEEVINNKVNSSFSGFQKNLQTAKSPSIQDENSHEDKYYAISDIETICYGERLAELSKVFARGVFSSKSTVTKSGLGEFMLERFISIDGKAMHPNAVRYMLYELLHVLKVAKDQFKKDSDMNEFERIMDSLKTGTSESGVDIDKFQVKSLKAMKKESNLKEMCSACDNAKLYGGTDDGDNCESLLKGYFESVQKCYVSIIGYAICDVAIPAVMAMSEAYRNFFNSFESRIPSIERKKEGIITKLEFKDGDYIRYLFGNRKHLNHLSSMLKRPADGGPEAAALYAKIFESLRNNSYIDARKNANPFAFEAKLDIFDDVIVEYFKKRVEDTCQIIDVKGVLQGIKLEYDVDTSLELSETVDSKVEEKAAVRASDVTRDKYIMSVIQTCQNLASPGIIKKDKEEAREVASMVCSENTEDADGIRVSAYIPKAIRSDTVSKYELRFFRSIYNVTPVQVSKLSPPSEEESKDEFDCAETEETNDKCKYKTAGDYFNIYQSYMDTIGPDSRRCAVITPHIDMRWNSISTMPELDIEYQQKLMKKIHKSMIYGFVYEQIKLYQVSDENPDEKIYRYLNSEYKTDLIVSNRTKCDVLYEVLDALYFDRSAVSVLRKYISDIRLKNRMKGYVSYVDSDFFKAVKTLTRKKIINVASGTDYANGTVSLFEMVLLYCNSLPVQRKDDSEMKTMIEAIIEMIESEMAVCSTSDDTVKAKTASYLVEQYNLFVDNYKKYNSELRAGIFSDDVVDTTYGAIVRTLKSYDQIKHIDDLNKYEVD